jgi:hypothetical protein
MGTFIIPNIIKIKRGGTLKTKKKGGKLIIIIILVFASIWFLSDRKNQEKLVALFKNKDIKVKDIKTKDIDLNISKSIPIEEGTIDIGNYKGIVLWNGEKLTKINNDGEIVKEKEFNFEEIGICMGDKNIYIYEKPTGEIYILNDNLETIDKIQMETRVENIVESFDYILIHTKEDFRESIEILNKDKKIIESIITENRSILNYSINSSGNQYMISTMSLESSGIKSEIQGFKIGGDELFYHEFKDEIVLYTEYIDKDKIILMTDSNLYCISGKEILWNRSYESLKDIYFYNGEIYILYSNTMEILSTDGDIKFNFSFSEEYRKILAYDNYIVLYGNGYIIGLDNEGEIFKYKSEDNIIKAVKDNRKIMILYNDKIDLGNF